MLFTCQLWKFLQDIGEGMYLEDLLSVDEEVANLYLQQSDRFL